MQSTEQVKIAGIQDPMQAIAYAKVERLDSNRSTTIQHEGVEFKLKELAECALTPCIRVYNISVSNGAPSVNILSEELGGLAYLRDSNNGSERHSPKVTFRSNYSDSSCWEPNSQTNTSLSHSGNKNQNLQYPTC